MNASGEATVSAILYSNVWYANTLNMPTKVLLTTVLGLDWPVWQIEKKLADSLVRDVTSSSIGLF